MTQKMLFRPGTVLLAVFIALIGWSFYSWASSSVSGIGEDTSEKQSQTVRCAGLETDFVSLNSRSGNSTVFFRINRDAGAVNVELQGDINVTRRIEDVSRGSLQRVSGNVENLDSVIVEVESCDQRFEYSQ